MCARPVKAPPAIKAPIGFNEAAISQRAALLRSYRASVKTRASLSIRLDTAPDIITQARIEELLIDAQVSLEITEAHLSFLPPPTWEEYTRLLSQWADCKAQLAIAAAA